MEFGGEMYLPGAASLLEQLDKKVLIILNDGRHLVGIMRSFDHFSNIVLEGTCERIISGGSKKCDVAQCGEVSKVQALVASVGKYCDIHLGVYIVRGDNISLLCEIDLEREKSEMPLEKVEPEDLPDVGKDDTVQWNFE